MTMRIHLASCAGFVALVQALLLVGCSGKVDGPPPAEVRSKAADEPIHGGAASMEELRALYEAAHRKRDFNALAPLCAWNARVRRLLTPKQANPKDDLMKALIKFPIRSVELEASPPREQGKDGDVTYRQAKRKRTEHVMGDTRGKLILVMANGERVDPSYVVVNYQGRFYLNIADSVARDAARHLQSGQPLEYAALPIEGTGHDRGPESPVAGSK